MENKGFSKAQQEYGNQEAPYTTPTKEINACETCGGKCDYKVCDSCYKKAVEERLYGYIGQSEEMFNAYFDYYMSEKINGFNKTEAEMEEVRKAFVNEDRTHFEDWHLNRKAGEE